MRGLIDMQAHFMAGLVMDRVELSVNLQNIPFDKLGTNCGGKGWDPEADEQRRHEYGDEPFHTASLREVNGRNATDA